MGLRARRGFCLWAGLAASACGAFASGNSISVQLVPSVTSPAPVGTVVYWNAGISGTAQGTLWYRFRTRRSGAPFQTVRDFGPLNTLDWTGDVREGSHDIEVTVRNLATGDSGVATSSFELTPLATDHVVITPTASPLVFLYSAPPCARGRMSVEFTSASSDTITPPVACRPGETMNFYLAGMTPTTLYRARHIVEGRRDPHPAPWVFFGTGSLPLSFPAARVLQGPATGGGLLLQAPVFQPVFATDLSGNVIWYNPGTFTLTRPLPGGHFLGFVQIPQGGASVQLVREHDLAGTTVRETNAACINEQLAALGKRQINAFHHEAAPMPGGRLLVLASTEQIMTGVQGDGPVDLLGDMILVLDPDLQVEWTWDAFDHLDPHHAATLGETCTPAGGGCPPFFLAPQANDWLHGNSLQLTPDGNILYSARHQDCLIKIDYANGQGDGHIIWRLGKDGDFSIASTDPSPWFSHQHDAGIHTDGTLTLFDNGNVRQATDPAAHSRGQVLRIDERNRAVEPILNADMGGYSLALGAAQKLPSGAYHFDVGWLDGLKSRSVEMNPAGEMVYSLEIDAPLYRSFRLWNLYSAGTDPVVPRPPQESPAAGIR